MSVLRREADDRVVLTLSGDLDMESVPEPVALLRTLGNFHVRVLVVDLAAVRFMDSTGLSFLDQLHTTAASHGMVVQLRGVAARIRALLAITSLDTRFTLEPPRTA